MVSFAYPITPIGKNIRLLRINKEKTQKTLASEVGISVNYLSQIENGRKSPSSAILRKIAQKLDVPETYLFLPEKSTQTLPEDLTKLVSLLEDIVSKIQEITKNTRVLNE